MVLHSKIHLAMCATLLAVASSAVLRGAPAAAKKAEVPKVATPNVTAKVAVNKTAPQDDIKTLQALGQGLQTIHNLRNLFTKNKADSPMDGAEKFANGALSEELSKKDSQVWSTIETMIGATQDAMKSIKGKSKTEQEQVMKSLEDKLDGKAQALSNVTDDVNKKQMQQDEEYLLGLLLLHQNDWSMAKQLNATEKFMHNSPIMQKLFKEHDASKPLAPQLAAMMDKNNKAGVAKVEEKTKQIEASAKKLAAAEAKAAPAVARLKKEEEKEKAAKAAAEAAAKTKVQPKAAPAVAKKETPKKNLGKAATAAAKTLFIQLTDTVMNRDCPYCAAQCVDKCHTAGKPYVQCLTDCADAGKQ